MELDESWNKKYVKGIGEVRNSDKYIAGAIDFQTRAIEELENLDAGANYEYAYAIAEIINIIKELKA